MHFPELHMRSWGIMTASRHGRFLVVRISLRLFLLCDEKVVINCWWFFVKFGEIVDLNIFYYNLEFQTLFSYWEEMRR